MLHTHSITFMQLAIHHNSREIVNIQQSWCGYICILVITFEIIISRVYNRRESIYLSYTVLKMSP